MNHPCVYCGQAVFKTLKDYELHRIDFHGFKPEPVKPMKLTGRTKDQIVKEVEGSWLKPFLVAQEIKPEAVTMKAFIAEEVTEALLTSAGEAHLDACTCNECFAKKLDALVEKSQKDLEELRKIC